MSEAQDVQQFTNNVISWFNQAYYFNKEQTWFQTYWRGVHVFKTPADLWSYQEILHETKPTVVIETGTAQGGGTLYLAQMGELMGGIRVISIDIANEQRLAQLPQHPAISYLSGSSTDAQAIQLIRQLLKPHDRVMVILDSDHARDHVLAELNLYAPMVSAGCYLVVEDTNVNGHPVYPRHGPGPMEAVLAWLPEHPEFQVDRSRERFMLTFNPNGYLRRK